MIPDIYINHYISEYRYLDANLFTSQSTKTPLIQQGTTSTTKYISHTLTLTNSLFDEINAFFYSIRSTHHWKIFVLKTFSDHSAVFLFCCYIYVLPKLLPWKYDVMIEMYGILKPDVKQYRSSFSQPTPTKVLAIFVLLLLYCVICKATGWDKCPPLHLLFFSFRPLITHFPVF